MLLGIDFGTTRTVVAAVDRGNYPIITFQTESGDVQPWYPSLIAACGGRLRYGWQAQAREYQADWFLLRSLKRCLVTMGPDSPVELGDQSVPTLTLLTGYLAQLRTDLCKRSSLEVSPREPLQALISVPANANSNQRFLTLEAFRRAGFHVLGMINEPSAAGIEYAHRYLSKGPAGKKEYLVVYDLGGGTFDAAVLSIQDRRHEVLTSEGISRLGGDDFDEVLLGLALETEPIGPLTPQQRHHLLEECRERKEGLHPNTRKIAVDLGRATQEAGEIVVSTAEFYRRCEPLVEETVRALERAFHGQFPDPDSADWKSVAGIYLVGGSSELPLVSRLLRERYGRRVRKSAYPFAATAIGLAIAADGEAGYTLRESFTRHFGVWRESQWGQHVVFDPIFEKDTGLPETAGSPLVQTRTYHPAHNIAHLRYLECSQVGSDGQPRGDITPWEEIFFPVDPGLQDESRLDQFPVGRTSDFEHQIIEERYQCDPQGIIEVTITNHNTGHRRSHHLRSR